MTDITPGKRLDERVHERQREWETRCEAEGTVYEEVRVVGRGEYERRLRVSIYPPAPPGWFAAMYGAEAERG